MTNEQPDPAVTLTGPQRRHLAVYLERVDEGLRELSNLMASPARSLGVLRSERNDIAPGFAGATELISEARGLIRRTAGRLDLTSVTVSRHRRIQALLMSMIVILEDAGSRGLRGYGTVEESVRTIVDPELEQIRTRLVQIRGMLGAAVAPFDREEPGA